MARFQMVSASLAAPAASLAIERNTTIKLTMCASLLLHWQQAAPLAAHVRWSTIQP